jgi:hypothetical protein
LDIVTQSEARTRPIASLSHLRNCATVVKAIVVDASCRPRHVEAVHAFLRFQITDHRTGDPLVVSGDK